jgi:hypothetical protein
MDLKEMGWNHLALDREQFLLLVNTVRSLRVP